MNVADALRRSFSDAKSFIIGSLLSLIPILNLAVSGYGLQCAKSTKKMPKFSKESWILGLKSIIVNGIYGFLVILILAPILFFAAGPAISQMIVERSFNYEYLVPHIGLFFLIFFLGILFIPILIMAKLILARTENISDAIKIRSIIKQAYKRNFIVPVLIATLVKIALAFVLSAIPFIGWIIAPYILSVFTWSYISSNFSTVKI